ncbi:MAG: DsbA family protein [Renibacterium sp.]|nr:DsbA family protein [Renibacterium sp.]
MSPQNEPRTSKAERTAAAREQAKLIREAEAKRQKRNSWLIRGGVLVAAVAIIVVVALVVVNTMRNNAPIADSGPVPANMNTFGGYEVGKDLKPVAPTASANTVDKGSVPAATAGVTPSPDLANTGIAASASGQPVSVVIYLDFLCPFCKTFETSNGEALKQLANDGKITLEYRPTGLLDGNSTTNYSSRAAAAAAAVANTAPDKYLDFFTKLYDNQPQEGGAGLSNDQLKQYAKDLGINVDAAIDDKTYRPYVQYATALATAKGGVTGTPTAYIDGQVFKTQTQDFSDFKTSVQSAIDAKK